MNKIIIRGPTVSKGVVNISGAKNAALPILAASLLTQEKVMLSNVPHLHDIDAKTKLMRSLGVTIQFDKNIMTLHADQVNRDSSLDNTMAGQIRTSVLLLGPLLHRFKKVKLAMPGGCNIGKRAIDLHFEGLSNLGVKIDNTDGSILASTNELHAGRTVLSFPSVGATETLMITASIVKGTSYIENAAKEPEIVDLANFLNSMGANITGAGTNVIKISGVKELHGAKFAIMPDRIETGTYLTAAAITKGDLLLRNVALEYLESVVSVLRKIGIAITEDNNGVRVNVTTNLRSTNIITEVYPGFPTDMQPILTALLSVTNGKSIVNETIYENRFNHVPELIKMGANITIQADTLHITGVNGLNGAEVRASDIRAGAALILAAIGAKGTTVIDNADQILRGYENPVGKLRGIGVDCDLLM